MPEELQPDREPEGGVWPLNKAVTGALVFLMVAPVIWFLWWMVASTLHTRDTEELAKRLPDLESAELPLLVHDVSAFDTMVADDGSTMVLIPAGPFTMGADSDVDIDEMPAHQVYVDAFWMDTIEVSNERYVAFATMTERKKQAFAVFQDDIGLLLEPTQPATGVSWHDARGYCLWLEKRLPTEAEWEKAARGPTGWRYPWGSRFVRGFANVEGEADGYRYAAPVDNFPEGRSMFGLYNMAGNVSEWVFDWYGDDYYQTSSASNPAGPEISRWRVYRGGSWSEGPTEVRTTKRFAAFPARADAIIGFRCAQDVRPA